ncbi:hypothetical protein N9N67_08120 [Bacteriovoracaceae bacterium]|nr:hypothetical protein [Bacteriovoracaceae bacterium]
MKSLLINALLLSLIATSCVYRSSKKKKKDETKKTDLAGQSQDLLYEGGVTTSDTIPSDLYRRLLVQDEMEWTHPVDQKGVCEKGVHVDSDGEVVGDSTKCLRTIGIEATNVDRTSGEAYIIHDDVTHRGRYNIRYGSLEDKHGIFKTTEGPITYIHFIGYADSDIAEMFFKILPNNSNQIKDLSGNYYSNTDYIHDAPLFSDVMFFERVKTSKARNCLPKVDGDTGEVTQASDKDCFHHIRFDDNGNFFDLSNNDSYQLKYRIEPNTGIIRVYGTKAGSKYKAQYLIIGRNQIADYNGVQGKKVWTLKNRNSME